MDSLDNPTNMHSNEEFKIDSPNMQKLDDSYNFVDVKTRRYPFFSLQNKTLVKIMAFIFVVSLVGLIGVVITTTFPKHIKDKLKPITPSVIPTPVVPPHTQKIYNGPFLEDLTGKVIKDSFGNIYKIIGEFQRDGKVFTEGLSWINKDTLLESSGYFNEANIHFLKIDRENMRISQVNKQSMNGKFFGEGSDIFLDSNNEKKIFQLTWTAHKIFQYDINLKKLERTFEMTKEIPYGWAMTADWDNRSIAYIDTGNDIIYKVKTSEDFKLLKKIPVTDLDGQGNRTIKVNNINEIEFVNGYLLANKWMTNQIYKIDPETGYVANKFDFTALHSRALALQKKRFMNTGFGMDDVFNGIAFNRDTNTQFLTGKNWSKIFEVQIITEDSNL